MPGGLDWVVSLFLSPIPLTPLRLSAGASLQSFSIDADVILAQDPHDPYLPRNTDSHHPDILQYGFLNFES